MNRCSLATALVALMGCTDGTRTDSDGDLPTPAPLAEVSSGCPDLSEPGIKTFMSAGKERRAGILFPSDPGPDMPVLFAWHGLSTAEFDPMEQMIAGFDLAGLADDRGAVVIVPEAQAINLLGMDVLLWGILGNEQEEEDLTLYDDLRTCVAEAFDVDLRRISSWGHSGGGLWTSMLLMDRADTLAAGVSSSGGIELEIPVLGDRLPFRQPARQVPTMIVSGGAQDVWPDTTFTIIEFEATSDTLQQRLLEGGSFVVRCKHDLGHNYLPNWYWGQVQKWLFNHTYGATSEWESGDRRVHEACEVVSL